MNTRWLGLCVFSACLLWAGIVFLVSGWWFLALPFFAAGVLSGRAAYEEDVRG